MFRRFHEKRKNEEGFTLIELLVVILIIAILAAIAIPVFLRQREKGWRSQVQSALKNAATAQESYATANNGQYTATLDDLENATTGEGLKYADDVTIAAPTVDANSTSYCMTATHAQLPDAEVWAISSDISTPQEGTCAAGVMTPAT